MEVQPPQSASARPKRNTRLRTTKATSANSSTDDKAEPIRRSTRATSRRTAAKAAQKRIEDSFEEISEESGDKSSMKGSELGFAEGEGSESSKKLKRESISLQQVKMSICKVSLEKVASPVTTPTDAKATPPPPLPKETNGQEEELTVNLKDEKPTMEETMEASSSHETTRSTTIGKVLDQLSTRLLHIYSTCDVIHAYMPLQFVLANLTCLHVQSL